MVYGRFKQIRALLYPPYCLLCGQRSRTGRALCAACAVDVPWNRHCCPRCATPMAAESGAALCGQCLKSPPPWDSAQSPLRYEWPLDRLLQRFKFNSDLATGRVLSELLSDFLAAGNNPKPDVLIPVALHPARLRERGFNQALEFAGPVTRRLKLYLDTEVCVRHKNTAVQSTLEAHERHRNLRDAFSVRYALDGAHVAILDDVITTGATAAALSQALRAAGAAQISVWSLARAARRR